MKRTLLYLTLVPLILIAGCNSGGTDDRKGELSEFGSVATGTLRASVLVTSHPTLHPEPLGVTLRLDEAGDVLSLRLTGTGDQVIAGPVELTAVDGATGVATATGVSLLGMNDLQVQVRLTDSAAADGDVSVLIMPAGGMPVRAQQADAARLERLRRFVAYYRELEATAGLSGVDSFAMLVQHVFNTWLVVGDGGQAARDGAIDDLLDLFVGAAFQDIKQFLIFSASGAVLPGSEVIAEGSETLTGFRPELQEGEGRFRHFITNAAAMRYDWSFGLITNLVARLTGGDWGGEDPDVQADLATNAIGRDFHDFVFAATTAELMGGNGIRLWLLSRFAADPVDTTFRLDVLKEGDGSGVVTSSDGSIQCGSTCSADLPALTQVTLTAVADPGSVFREFLSDCSGGSCSPIMDRNRRVTAVFEVDPDPPGPSSPISFPVLNDVFRQMEALERILFPPRPQSAAECPTVAVAGAEGVLLQDVCPGGGQRLLELPDRQSFDARFLLPPEGLDGRVGLVASGFGYMVCHLNDQRELEGMCLISGPNPLQIIDSTLIGNDPTAGALLLDQAFNFVIKASHDPESGYVNMSDLLSIEQTPPRAASVIAGPGGSHLLVVSRGEAPEDPGQLYYLDMSGEILTPQLIGELAGPVPRRIRCDFASAVCAVSDFVSSRLSIISWDGMSVPELTGTTNEGQLADGPVGIDVMGNLVVSAGYSSNEFSIAELTAAGEVSTVTTRPLPADCQQPGHAIFLRDPAHSVVLSCHGSNSLLWYPEAFD